MIRLAVPLLFAVLVSLVGCADSSPASKDLLTELGRVAPVALGTPTLVFVYTDG